MNSDTVNSIGKWAGGFVVLAGVFALVWVGKAETEVFISLASIVLGGGMYHVATNNGAANVTKATSDQSVK